MPIIDVHAHYGWWSFPIRINSIEHINQLCERYEIEKVMLSSTEAIMCDMIRGNQQLAEAIKGQDRLLGYVVINPNYIDESSAEMRKYLYLPNFVGAKLHWTWAGQPLNSERTMELIKAYRRYDKPILIHTYSLNDALAVINLIKQFPGLIVIMAHMGGPDWERAVRAVENHAQIFVEPCSSQPHRDKVRFAVDRLGPRRVLFGSDMTLLHPAFVLGMVMDADLTDSQRQAILYRNAKHVFGL